MRKKIIKIIGWILISYGVLGIIYSFTALPVYYSWPGALAIGGVCIVFGGWLVRFGRVSQVHEPLEDQNWYKKIGQLKSEFDDINLEVQRATKSESVTYLHTAFHRVQLNLPRLIQELESLPPQSDKRKQFWTIFIQALKKYLDSCQHMKKSLEYDDKQAYLHEKNLMKEATQLLKQAKKILN